MTNEHFIVWMRTAALPQFRKLYGKIDTDIPAGTTLTFNVDAYFEVTSFGGKKSLGKPGPAPHTCDEGALREHLSPSACPVPSASDAISLC